MTPEEHRKKAAHDEQFIDEMFGDYVANTTPFLDWVVTAIYYTAVHKVDEYLASQGAPEHPVEHKDRRRFVQTTSDLRVISGEYRWLEDRSRDARYSLAIFNPANVRNWRAVKLGRIKTHLDRRIQVLRSSTGR